MAQDGSSRRDGLAGLRTLLLALEQSEAEPGETVELLIRVQGKEDRTLRLTLSGVDEVRAILKMSLGVD